MNDLGLAIGKHSREARVVSEIEFLAMDVFGDEPFEFVRVDIDPVTGLPADAELQALDCTLTDEPPILAGDGDRMGAGAYLVRERQAQQKSEFWDGEVVSMAGAPDLHGAITTNVGANLYVQLAGRGCRVYQSDMRVQVEQANAYVYPDVVVACGERQFADRRSDVLLNPTLLVEVLSPSTERHDRSRKARAYRGIASLREYVLISQKATLVECYRREDGGEWASTVLQRLDDVLHLDSVGCALPLSAIYRDVFPAAESVPARGSETEVVHRLERQQRDA